MANVQTRLMVNSDRASTPAKIIASTGTSYASAAIIAKLRSERAAQKEATAALIALMNTMLTHIPPGGGTGTGGGGGGKNATKERKPDPKARNTGCAGKWSGIRTITDGPKKGMQPPAPVGGSPACRISRGRRVV